MVTSLLLTSPLKQGEELKHSETSQEAIEEGQEQMQVNKDGHTGDVTNMELEEGELPVESKEEPEEGELVHQPAKSDSNNVKEDNSKIKKNITINGEFNCDKCRKSFVNEMKLNKHRSRPTAHSTGSGDFQCEVCQKRFPSNSSLILHKNIHLPEKPFKCTDCGKEFSQKGNLKSHKKRHHEDTANESNRYKGFAVLQNVKIGQADTGEEFSADEGNFVGNEGEMGEILNEKLDD